VLLGLDRLLDDLNPPQREAVTVGEGPLLVLAGAGSGKTRVIAYRIAWLTGGQSLSPRNLLAVTFTNKAAKEMARRVEALLLPAGIRAPMIATFHSMCVRVLRQHALGRVDDEQEEVDPAGPGDHVPDEPLMTGHVDQ